MMDAHDRIISSKQPDPARITSRKDSGRRNTNVISDFRNNMERPISCERRNGPTTDRITHRGNYYASVFNSRRARAGWAA